MASKLPYGDWVNLMAEACGFERKAFKDMDFKDRRDLLVAASGMTWEAFSALPDATAQVEAIRKHSGGKIEVRSGKQRGESRDNSRTKADDEVVEGDGDGSGEAEGQDGEGEPSEGEADGEAEGDAQGEGEGEGEGEAEPEQAPKPEESPDDPTVTLKGLANAFGPVIQAMVKAAVAEAAEAFEGEPRERIEIKLPKGETRQIEGHVHPKFKEGLELAVLGFPVMFVGPAGTGKTTMARQIAQALGRPFGSVSCTAGMSEGELVGKLLPGEGGNFHYRPSQFVKLYEGGGIFLVDEIDAADPNVLLKVNQSIGSVRGGGLWHNDLRHENPEVHQHKDFVLLAAANTFGTGSGAQYVGRNQLDAATLDRFEVVKVDYDTEFEAKVGDPEVCKWLWAVRKRTMDAKLRRVVSTRAIERASLRKASGKSMKDLENGFFASWSKDERAKVEA